MEHERDFQRAKELAINYLSYRPRSSKEVRTHLIRKGYSTALVGQVVSCLQEYKYIDDRVFAQKWYKTRLIKGGYGPILIRKELITRGISPGICERLRQRFYPEDREREEARLFAEKRGWEKSSDIREKRRFYQALIRRGFSPVIAKEILKIR